MSKRHDLRCSAGYTIIEAIIAVAILTMVVGAIYEAFVAAMHVVERGRVVLAANALANEQFEIARNLPFSDVGLQSGSPEGNLLRDQTLTRSGETFLVTTTVRSIDDPFDGKIGETPNDTSPADYKLVALDIECTSCPTARSFRYQTTVAPLALEGASTNGALFVEVFDAFGQPVVNAAVHIENNQASPAITIDDETNNEGMVQIVDILPGTAAYEITVSKDGYSSERTYLGGPWTPINPHANVVMGLVTEISLAITPASSLQVTTGNAACTPVGSVGFTLSGAKLIGTEPDTLKYSVVRSTDSSGIRNFTGMESDTYNIDLSGSGYDLIGSIPPLPLSLDQGTTQDLRLVVTPSTSRLLLVSVRDSVTGLPLSGANVRLENASYDQTRTTGSGYLSQTDWSGPSGQDNASDNASGYFLSANVNLTSPAGDIVLANPFGTYVASGELVSSTFDTGASSNFSEILWIPEAQTDTGPDSVKFQVATNNDGVNWDFLGPDGTAASYYTLTNRTIAPVHDGHRYIRYKVFLTTNNSANTPRVSDIQFTYTSSCVPPGQAFFSGLSTDPYDVTVSGAGYTTVQQPVSVPDSWERLDIALSP